MKKPKTKKKLIDGYRVVIGRSYGKSYDTAAAEAAVIEDMPVNEVRLMGIRTDLHETDDGRIPLDCVEAIEKMPSLVSRLEL